MALSIVHQILSGNFSPWNAEGPQQLTGFLTEGGSKPVSTAGELQQKRRRLWLNVALPEPYSRQSKIYQLGMEALLLEAQLEFIDQMESLSDEQEQREQFSSYYSQLKSLLQQIPALRAAHLPESSRGDNPQGGRGDHTRGRRSGDMKGGRGDTTPEEAQTAAGDPALTEFVLHSLALLLVNVLRDANLRYGYLAGRQRQDSAQIDNKGSHHNRQIWDSAQDDKLSGLQHETVADIYLEAFDRPLPDPFPFRFTLSWASYNLKRMLGEGARRFTPELEESIIMQLAHIGNRLENLEPASGEWHKIHGIKRHVKNGLLLILMNASFLKTDPEAITDARRCQEWVLGEKAEAERKMADVPADPSPLQEAYHALMQLKEIWDPVRGLFGTDRRSAAGKWMQEYTAAVHHPLKPVEALAQMQSKGRGPASPIDFSQEFHNTYVHVSEVEAAFGVDPKTLRKYLAKGNIPTLQLYANRWYRREELRRFLDENTK